MHIKDEIEKMETNDEFVKLKLTPERLKKFHDPELKEKYSKKRTYRITHCKNKNKSN